MTEFTHIMEYGNALVILFDDGSKEIAYPSMGGFWFVKNDFGTWVWPLSVPPWNFGDGYGPRINPVTGLPSFHYGIDINGAGITGEDILAASNGIVRAINTSISHSYGVYVHIEHDDGSGTFYAHMVSGSITVNIGDSVIAGQKLGEVGDTGLVTGPHLHFNTQENFSFSMNANTIDPIDFMLERNAVML